MNAQQLFAQAQQHHQAGRLAEAESDYRRALVREPNHPQVLHMLGILMSQTGRLPMGADLLVRAVRMTPNDANIHANLGVMFDRLGRLNDALGAFQSALKLRPNDAIALTNMGDALRRAGRVQEAIAVCRKAAAVDPKYIMAHINLAQALGAANDWDQAISAYRAAVELKPDYVEALNDLGDALRRRGRSEEGIAYFRQAIAHNPNYAPAHNNLGAAFLEMGNLEEGVVSVRQALAIQPDMASAHHNLGNYFLMNGRRDEALAAYQQAVALKPDYGLAHHQIGWVSLLLGRWEQGWREYEWRLTVPEFNIVSRNYRQPRWDGSPLNGRRIFLYGEQGFGDRIQFARYIYLVAERGGKIILTCRSSLMRLYRGLQIPVELVGPKEKLPEFDVHCSLASLPGIFGTKLETIPNRTPYLVADPSFTDSWRTRLSPWKSKLKIGLAWSGDPRNQSDRYRSIPLAELAPLSGIANAEFFSLQKGPAAQPTQLPPAGWTLTDWTSELKDFADTAALITALDLVVTVDTAIAHLAGALGKPTWLLLPFACDWRWLLNRSDSPWYPTLRIFRQPRLWDWKTPVEELVAAAAKLI